MADTRSGSTSFLGIAFIIGTLILGYFFSSGIVKFRTLDRSVTVKGLSEREVLSDIAIWRIQYAEATNSLNEAYDKLVRNNEEVAKFLIDNGFDESEISVSMPVVEDLKAQSWRDQNTVAFRYTANSATTVYTKKVDLVREKMKEMATLGKKGIAISAAGYRTNSEFLFNDLNSIKPEMVEEATRNARAVAVKFAEDSDSKLGKIRAARQGQFSITDRDSNTPHIKRVRVVSTIEYYLTD